MAIVVLGIGIIKFFRGFGPGGVSDLFGAVFSVLLDGHGVWGLHSASFSSMVGSDIMDSIVSPNTFCRHCPAALIDLSSSGGRPGIVAVGSLTPPRRSRAILPDLRESIATSWTVVMGPNSDTLGFLRRNSAGSFDFDLLPDAGN